SNSQSPVIKAVIINRAVANRTFIPSHKAEKNSNTPCQIFLITSTTTVHASATPSQIVKATSFIVENILLKNSVTPCQTDLTVSTKFCQISETPSQMLLAISFIVLITLVKNVAKDFQILMKKFLKFSLVFHKYINAPTNAAIPAINNTIGLAIKNFNAPPNPVIKLFPKDKPILPTVEKAFPTIPNTGERVLNKLVNLAIINKVGPIAAKNNPMLTTVAFCSSDSPLNLSIRFCIP